MIWPSGKNIAHPWTDLITLNLYMHLFSVYLTHPPPPPHTPRNNTNPSCLSLELDLSSPVRFREQDGQVGFPDEVLVCHFADGDDLFISTGHDLQGQRGFHLRPQHAQVRRQQVDEDLEKKRRHILILSSWTGHDHDLSIQDGCLWVKMTQKASVLRPRTHRSF